MCSEIDQFPSFLRRRRMSDPIDTKHDKEEIAITSQPLDSLPEPETAASVERESENPDDDDGGDHHHQKKKSPEEIKNEEEGEADKAAPSRADIDEDDDGFKTPTSSAHRIPAITECPPPPVKPRPPPSKLKRKASPPQSSPPEVDSLFPPIESGDQSDNSQQHKMKKARTEDKDRS